MIRLQAGGVPVGIFTSCIYEEGMVQLGPGDRIIAYTDGVTEALSPAGEEWASSGSERRRTKEARNALVTSSAQSLQQWMNSRGGARRMTRR
jgi:serine phosphatase RsbU (regulator of sigma subunit)